MGLGKQTKARDRPRIQEFRNILNVSVDRGLPEFLLDSEEPLRDGQVCWVTIFS